MITFVTGVPFLEVMGDYDVYLFIARVDHTKHQTHALGCNIERMGMHILF